MTINRHFLTTLCAMVVLADVAPVPGCSSRTSPKPPATPASVTTAKPATATPLAAPEAPKPAAA